MNENIQIKVRFKLDKTKWENINVFGTYPYKKGMRAVKLLCAYDDIQEVRWNYLESPQGHYTFGNHAEF